MTESDNDEASEGRVTGTPGSGMNGIVTRLAGRTRNAGTTGGTREGADDYRRRRRERRTAASTTSISTASREGRDPSAADRQAVYAPPATARCHFPSVRAAARLPCPHGSLVASYLLPHCLQNAEGYVDNA
ncbi:hypothetical protein Xph01_46220 [Micromonospora phaseoli]|nr:hypothetical protein Xph01_46220 [Micromonospora phaseoli]